MTIGISPLFRLAETAMALVPTAFGQASLIPSSGIYGGCDFTNPGPINNTFAACIPVYIGYVIGVIFSISGGIFFIVLLLGGYQYVLGTAGFGNKEEGIARVRFGIIGMLVTALSFYIVEFFIFAVLS